MKIHTFIKFFFPIISRPLVDSKTGIPYPETITLFKSNPNFPQLISFPRTGSHWLRMLMEFYFEKPSLALIYFYKDAQSFTCYHQHDLERQTQNVKNVIYLYRNPVDTVFSLMMYHNEDMKSTERVMYWVHSYEEHLKKWLYDERFTEKKVIIRYEDLKTNATPVFKDLCNFFGYPFENEKMTNAILRATKENLKGKTMRDPKVVILSENYESERITFRNLYASSIFDKIFELDNRFNAIFNKK